MISSRKMDLSTFLLRKRRRKKEEEVSGKKKVDKELEERKEGYIKEKSEYDNSF